MKLFQKILLLVFLVGLPCCERIDCWGNTMESKDKPYRGDPKATAPYYKTREKLDMMQMGCEHGSCTQSVGALVELHNPTDKAVVADVFCVYYLNEIYEADKNSRKDVKVGPRVEGKSGFKLVKVSGMVPVTPGVTSQIGVTCEVSWR